MQFGVIPRSNGPLARKLAMQAMQARRPVIEYEPDPPELSDDQATIIQLRATIEELRAAIDLLTNPPPPPPAPTAASIMREVADEYGMTVHDLKSAGRTKPLIEPRHKAMYRCAAETVLSLPQIGHAFRRDHTTVLHAIRSHHERSGLKAAGVPLPRGMVAR